MDKEEQDLGPYECVEPELGQLLWRLEAPDLGPDVRHRLTRHLEICDACRLSRAVEGKVEEGVRDGSLRLKPSLRTGARRRLRLLPSMRPAPAAGWGGGLAVAASLTLMLMLPPQARRDAGIERGPDAGPGFERPIEGEIVLDRSYRLRWNRIAGASSYRVTVSEIDGEYLWRGESAEPAATIPPEDRLPQSASLRAFVEPIPTDLAPPGGISVTFRTDRWNSFLTYRLSHAPFAVLLLGLSGCLALLLTASRHLLRRPGC